MPVCCRVDAVQHQAGTGSSTTARLASKQTVSYTVTWQGLTLHDIMIMMSSSTAATTHSPPAQPQYSHVRAACMD